MLWWCVCDIIIEMFCRNFMKQFPIRKYGNITAKSGSISSDIWIINEGEIRVARPIVYFLITGLALLAFDNFHTVDEIIGPTPRPLAYTNYESNIPKDVLLPNLPIIAGFEAINKMKELQKSITYDQ